MEWYGDSSSVWINYSSNDLPTDSGDQTDAQRGRAGDYIAIPLPIHLADANEGSA